MFSGIVQSLGTIVSIDEASEIVTLEVQTTEDFIKDLKVGDSVALDGVCLTLTRSESDRMFFDAVPETLSKTLIKSYTKGTKVNLEPSLKFNDSVGGHIVSGHIHTTGHVNQVEIHGDAKDIVIDAGADWGKFLFEKGYIGINGCSITLGEITEGPKHSLIQNPSSSAPMQLHLLHIHSLPSKQSVWIDCKAYPCLHPLKYPAQTNRSFSFTLANPAAQPYDPTWLTPPFDTIYPL